MDEKLLNFIKIISSLYLKEETLSLFMKNKNEDIIFNCVENVIGVSIKNNLRPEINQWNFIIPADMKEIEVVLKDYREMDINQFVLIHGRDPFRQISTYISSLSKSLEFDILNEIQDYR